VRLAGGGGWLSSNGLGFAEYKLYNGAILSDDDKHDILNAIDASGLSLRADAAATALAIHQGRWALAASVVGAGQGRLDRDAVELILFGNAEREEWNLDGSDAEGFAAWQLALSHGRRLATLGGGPLNRGVTAKYLRGLYYGGLSEVRAEPATETTGLTGEGLADLTTSNGGSGFGLDLGASWHPNDKTSIGLKIENVVHRVHWNSEVTVRRYNVQFEDLTLDNFDDSLWVAEDSEHAGAAFGDGLPLTVRFGIGHSFSRTRLALEAAVAGSEKFGASTTPRTGNGRSTPWCAFACKRVC